MNATRRTQPFRKHGLRPQGASLSAMLRGAPLHGQNPQNLQRLMAKRMKQRRMKHRQHVTRQSY